jgi:DNA-binding CsgD family transcriptional regulator
MTDLLERDAFIAALDGLLADAGTGDGRLVLIGGDAGIGKTALIDAFCQSHASTTRVLAGACDALSTPRPLGPLLDISRQAGGELQRLLTTGANREPIFGALLNELGQHSQPIIVVIEDIHWADDATVDLIRFLARRLSGLRALVIATYRDVEIGPHHPFRLCLGDLATSRSVRRIVLPPLSEEAVRVLAGSSSLDPSALHRQTGGNPFFVAEILASGEPGMPATVRDAVLARIARLGSDARAALDVAAVLGFRSESWLLTDLLGSGAAALDACVVAGVLRPEPGGFAFRHELARDAVLDAISPVLRCALHRRALEALRLTADDPDALARLAHHADMAGDREAVLAYAPAAARRAVELQAHREAAAQYARALRWSREWEPAVRAPLLEGFAYHSYLTDRHTEAVDAWTQALAIWRRVGNPLKEGEILRLLSRPLWYLGRSSDAEASISASLSVLEPLPRGVELGWAWSDLSRLRMLAGESEAAVVWGKQAFLLGERLGDAGLQAHALNNVGCARLELGDEGGSDDLERGLAIALAANLDEHAGRSYANLVSMALISFQLARAEHWGEEGSAFTLDHDVETYRLCLMSQRPVQLFLQGRWSEAVDLASTLLSRADLSPLYRLLALTVLGRVRARRGDPEAAAALDAALALAGPTVDLSRRVPVFMARIEAAWLTGDHACAEAEINAACVIAGELNDPWLKGELAYWRWQVGSSAKPPSGIAKPYAQQLAGDWARSAASWESLGCPYEAALALADSGDEAALQRALAEFNQLGARPMAAAVTQRLRRLGALGIARGPRPTTRANPARLTAREMEVWDLLAEGLRNAEIANRLSVSTKTVDHHVSAVLAKLGVRTRTEAAHARALHAPSHRQSGELAHAT